MKPIHLVVPMLLAALAARAEIRVERSPATMRADVHLTPTAAGPWTATGPVDMAVLNAQGDLDGDGAPAIAESDAGWIVAWSSPSREELRLARTTATASSWLPTASIRLPDAIGTPLIVRCAAAWLVATRTRDGRVAIVGATDQGRVSEPVDLGPGHLLGGRSAGRDGQLLMRGRDGCLDVVVVQILVPDPRPIDIYRSPICLPPPRGGLPGTRPPGERTPAPGPGDSGGRDGDRRCGPGDGSGGSRERRSVTEPDLGITLSDVTASDGSTRGLVAWRTSASEMTLVDVADDGTTSALRVEPAGDLRGE